MTEAERKLIEQYADSDVNALALKLRDSDNVDSKFVLRQIAGRQVMRRKMPLWASNPDVQYPDHLPLEQCSSFFTANYKKEIGERLLTTFDNCADLTGGFGVDFFVMSENFSHAIYAERNTNLCDVVRHNFEVLHRSNAEFLNSDGVDFIKNTAQHFNIVFIDPARRNSAGKKTVRIEDCEPDILIFQDIMIKKADVVMIKLSPMIDIADIIAKLHNVSEIHLVATANECKEVLVVLQDGYNSEPRIFTVNDNQRYTFILSNERNCAINYYKSTNLNGKYLFEPNAAVMKSGAFKILTQDYNVSKLHVSSHLYIADHDIKDFPGRRFKVERAGQPKEFCGIGKANLAVRNFPEKAEILKKKLKICDGGDIFLFATTIYNGSKVFIQCCKV
ncbi:MAG: RsmD family RNA methyltransferase [Bacteroidales bacterium]|nr:RsmD family RNA methyltransferase [Bacteroidales bacterium]